ncbi:uncharacterized protein RCC_10116 [Ramularia collo-cygni]|uniref:Zn(2)-C6 fungal-type domain-containing protein n=1 Tax=Ramularia collo-cygni TaxID=112498 RepID=A0A2D3VJ50_9PEZI|nr:uncharacterized protein RCC_10116 [Ramularia collo-cygni]CZT24391.1 uncharacterized protein RCC_10116 [Ramularia collo-cygni]
MSSPLEMEIEEAQATAPSPGQGLRPSFACDHCRVRKVRCDGQDPCQPCISAKKKDCTRQRVMKPREKRQKLLVSAQYEKKIDQMEERLDQLVSLLAEQSKARHHAATSPQGTVAMSPSVGTPTSWSRELEPTFEGESSMLAHSRSVNELVEKTINQTRSAEPPVDCNETRAALTQLISSLKPKHEPQDAWFDDATLAPPPPPRTELPPFTIVAALLKAERESPRYSLCSWFNKSITIEALTQHCVDVYFAPTYSHSQLIIATSHLMWLLLADGGTPRESSQREIYHINGHLCRMALETTLASLPFHMPATKETAYAMFLGALHAITSMKPALAWTLISKASEICQSLGFHRCSTMKSDDGRVAQQKMSIFWWVYIMDKGLSLRLGRVSNLNDCDIDVATTFTSDPQSDLAGVVQYFVLSIAVARIQGKVYERLYSAASLAVAPHECEARVFELVEELSVLQDLLTKSRIELLQSVGSQVRESAVLQGDEVALLSLTTLVYRSLTPLDGFTFDRRCTETARSALQCHVQYMASLDVAALEEYVNWAILYTPFIPVIVIFCNAIETVDLDDLQRLQSFVASFEPTRCNSPTIQRLHDRFLTLHEIASRIIELRRTQSRSDESGKSTRSGDTILLEANTGQALPPSGDQDVSNPARVATTTRDFLDPAYNEAWFRDYQQMLDQLKEDDLFLFGTNIL